MRFARLALVPASLLASLALAQFPGAEPAPDQFQSGLSVLNEQKARGYLEIIAGEEFAGRGTGQIGYQKAAEWVAMKFKEFGLKGVAEDGGYLQDVPFIRSMADPENSVMAGPNGLWLELGDHLGISGISEDLLLTGQVGFLHLESDRAPQVPAEIANRLIVLSGPGATRRGSFIVQRAGARGVITISESPSSESSVAPAGGGRRGGGFAVQISPQAAARLARATGARMPSAANPLSRGTGRVTIKASAKVDEIGIPNVVGLLEGSDPSLAPEHVALGCHLDHLGVRNGQVYYGADDDGSGSAALVMVAEAFSKSKVKPKRGILFLAFAAEEIGLVGSRYYSENPLLPLDKCSALLQMDMIGRNEEKDGERPEDNVDTIHLVGSKRNGMELHNLTLAMNRYVGLKFEYDEEGVYTRSDHYMLARYGVPVTFLFAGFHPDYHQTTDTIDKINFAKIVASARLNYMVAMTAANMPDLLSRGE